MVLSLQVVLHSFKSQVRETRASLAVHYLSMPGACEPFILPYCHIYRWKGETFSFHLVYYCNDPKLNNDRCTLSDFVKLWPRFSQTGCLHIGSKNAPIESLAFLLVYDEISKHSSYWLTSAERWGEGTESVGKAAPSVRHRQTNFGRQSIFCYFFFLKGLSFINQN